MAANGSPILTDGSLNFIGGVDSLKPATIATQANPNGLRRDQLAWLVNGSVRDGGIEPRSGWTQLLKLVGVRDPSLLGTVGYQGGFLYRPLDGNPYLIVSIGGVIYQVSSDFSSAVNLSAKFGLSNPKDIPHAYFCQGEQFLVIQAGDGKTLPLFWDGTILRRSNGFKNSATSKTIVSTDQQGFTVPLAGGSVDLTWSSVAALSKGAQVTIYNAGTTFSQGLYTITNISGNTLSLEKVDFNFQPFWVSGKFDLVAQINPFPFEIPAGYAMDYYMQRIWYVFGDQRTYTAGDIVGNTTSGTQAYNFTDSILRVTENPLALGGDGFHIPSDSGNIRALTHTANIDAALGQGLLYITTRKQIYSLQVPVSRGDWVGANNSNAPLQTIVQLVNGATGDRCIVPVNGDLYYQSLEPAIRSLIIATRYFGQPGNTPISSPETRIIQFNNRALLSFASGIAFNNRMLQTALPKQTTAGVVHQALIPLDFTPLNEPPQSRTQPPVWEGHYEGLDMLQLFVGDFGGLERAFAVVVSRTDGGLWVWELTQGALTESGDNRITWQVEFPAFNWGDDFSMKKLQGGELWIDRLSGTAEFTLEYRPDSYSCYIPWFSWKECSARDCEENIPTNCPPLTYPPTPPTPQGLGYRQTIGFPKPPTVCDKQMARPSDQAHQFQCRLTIKGSCRIRGIFLHASKYERQLYANVPCAS